MQRGLEGFDHFKLVKLVCGSLISWNMEGKKEASNPKKSPRHLFRPNCKKRTKPFRINIAGILFLLLKTNSESESFSGINQTQLLGPPADRQMCIRSKSF